MKPNILASRARRAVAPFTCVFPSTRRPLPPLLPLPDPWRLLQRPPLRLRLPLLLRPAAPAVANINGSTMVQDDSAKPVAAMNSLKSINNAAFTPEGASRGDTAWMIVASALVMLMTPGLAFFYGGLVRSKNVLNTLMMSFAALGIISVQWMLWGYSVAFGPTEVKVAGIGYICQSVKLDGAASAGAGAAPVSNAPTIPGAIFMLFQMTFAIITPALISGAIAERMKFGAYCLVYSAVGHVLL